MQCDRSFKVYHQRKVQKMNDLHKGKMMEFFRWALQKYGIVANGRTVWGRLVNTDFSTMEKQDGNTNSKNAEVWSHSREEGGLGTAARVSSAEILCIFHNLGWGDVQRFGAFRYSGVFV